MEIKNLDLKYIAYNEWQLEEDYKYSILNLTIIVPKGFITDLASIPKIFWNIIEPFGKDYISASIIHDYLYSANCKYKFINRKTADLLFYEIMKENGVNFIKRNIMYSAVRIFGGKYFRFL